MIRSLITNIALWAYDHAKTLIAVLLLLLVASLVSLQYLAFDMSNEGSLKPNNPIRVEYNDFKRMFGRDDYILVTADLEKAKQKGISFSQAYRELQTLKEAIQSDVPYVDEVDSFSNIRYTYSQDDELIIRDLIEIYESQHWKNDQEFLDFASRHPLYKNRFIAEDKKYIALNIKLQPHISKEGEIDLLADDLASLESDVGSGSEDDLKPLDSFKISDAIKQIKQTTANSPLDVHITGAPYLVDALNRLTIVGSSITGSLAVVFSMILMWLFFRRLLPVLIPLFILNLSMIFALALKVVFGVPYTLFTGVIVPLMIAISISDAVHILTRFFSEYEKSGDKRQAIADSIDFSATAILLTSLTTTAGFLSFAIGDVESIAKLGIFTGVAVMSAFFLSITLIPAMLKLVKIKRNVNNRQLFGKLESLLSACAELSIKHYKAIIASTVVIMGLCLINIINIEFSHDNVAVLKDSSSAKQDYYHINKAFKSVNPLEVIIDTQVDGGALNLELLKSIEKIEKKISEKEIDGVFFSTPYSMISLIKEINMGLLSNDKKDYVLPNNIELIKQELNLFESSAKDDLFDVVDDGFRVLRTTLTLEDADGVVYHQVLPKVQKIYEQNLPKSVKVTLTGNTALVAETVPTALYTMMKSYATALFIITLFIIFIIQNIKLGLVSIIPNILPILLVMNLMVIMDWKLDLTTILVGAIAIGIVVDDTLHFLHRYKESIEEGYPVLDAIKHTLTTTGRALLITTIIYSIAASANILSPMPNFVIFGITLSLATALALLADIILTPAFIVGLNRKKIETELQTNNTGTI